jgi:hypothetical protein
MMPHALDLFTQLESKHFETRTSLKAPSTNDGEMTDSSKDHLPIVTSGISPEEENKDGIPFRIFASVNDDKLSMTEGAPSIDESFASTSETGSEIRAGDSNSFGQAVSKFECGRVKPVQHLVRVSIKCKDESGVFQRVLLKHSIESPLHAGQRCACIPLIFVVGL